MLQEEKELRLNQLRLIVMIMTLIFAFMLIYTIYFLVDYKDKYGFFEKTTAEVIEHQDINGKEYDLISYMVNGNEFRITTEYESKNEIGDTITIYYDTNNPLGVIYSLDSRRVWLPLLTTIFGCANIGLVVMYFLLRKGIIKSKNKESYVEVLDKDVVLQNESEKTKPVKENNASNQNTTTVKKIQTKKALKNEKAITTNEFRSKGISKTNKTNSSNVKIKK